MTDRHIAFTVLALLLLTLQLFRCTASGVAACIGALAPDATMIVPHGSDSVKIPFARLRAFSLLSPETPPWLAHRSPPIAPGQPLPAIVGNTWEHLCSTLPAGRPLTPQATPGDIMLAASCRWACTR